MAHQHTVDVKAALKLLEMTNLVEIFRAQPELVYQFRHTLVVEAAYQSMLKTDRRILHQKVGEALEKENSDRIEEIAPVLGWHFSQSRDHQRALAYYSLSGDLADKRYAVQEAVSYYSEALRSAESLGQPADELYRKRGAMYEILGQLDQARDDYLKAIDYAQSRQDRPSVIRSLLDLGMLWAGSDYARTRVYYEQAIIQAYQDDNPVLLAQSLNSMGNWYINHEQPEHALAFHRKALEISEKEQDPRGIAETLDFLGMASAMSGDVIQGANYYTQAIEHFESLGDRKMLAHCLGTFTLCGNGTYQTQHLLGRQISLVDSARQLDLANQICEEIHWQSGKAYTAFLKGSVLGPLGEIGQAISVLNTGSRLAEEIHHRQWQTACHTITAQVYLDIFAYPMAHQHASIAEASAQEISSSFFTRISKSLKAWSCIHQGDFSAAERLLDEVLPSETPPHTLTERLAACVRAIAALGTKAPAECIAILETMYPKEIYTMESSEGCIPLLSLMFGEAMFAVGQKDTARVCLQGSADVSRSLHSKSIEWRAHRSLALLYRSTGEDGQSDQERSAAISILDQIARSIPEAAMSKAFLEQAHHSLQSGKFI